MVDGLTKPLAAVSDACDKGNIGFFDNDGNYLVRRDSPEGREMRRLAAAAKEKIPVERKNGVYGMNMFIQEPSNGTNRPFTRRGNP